MTVKNGNVPVPAVNLPAGKQSTAVEVKDNTPSASARNLDQMFTDADQAAATGGKSVEIKLVVGLYLDAHLLKMTGECRFRF